MEVKVLVVSKYFVHTREWNSSPGVVWCIHKVLVLFLVKIMAMESQVGNDIT